MAHLQTFQHIQAPDLLQARQTCKSDGMSDWQQTWTWGDLCARVPKLKGPRVTGRTIRTAEGLNGP